MSTPLSVLYSIALFVVLAVAIYLAPDEAATRVPEPPSADLPHREKESHTRGSSTNESIDHNCGRDRKQKKRASKRVNAPACSVKSQANADGKVIDIDDNIDKAQRSTRRRTRKPRTVSPDGFLQRQSQPRTKATPANVVDPSHKPQCVATPEKPAQPRDYVEPSDDLSSPTSPEPGIRVLNPVLAYKWFHTVRCSVFENGRADLLLGHGSVPLELAFMLALGWVAFDECLEWADGRETAGEGLIALADYNAKGVELILAESATRPREEEVRAFAKDWMKIKSPEDCPYDWALDAEDRKKHGPFGPTLARVAAPNELEGIWTRIADPAVDPKSTRLPDSLTAVLQPLLVSRGALKRPEQDNIPTVAQADKWECAETVKSVAESELSDEQRDHDEADLKSESDGSAPPSYPKIDTLVISSSPVPSTILSRDLSPSTLSPSTIASPLEEPAGLKPFQTVQVDPTHTSGDLGGFSEDSDMEDDTAVWPSTGFPTPDNSLSLNFDFDSIPFICCEETDVDMLPVQELSADCDLRVMAVDPYIPEPPVWYSSNAIVVDSTIQDDEMQEAVPIPLPESVRQPIPRSSSITTVEMQDVTSIPHTFVPPPLQYAPQIVISSPSTFVPSPSTNHISREPAVTSQSQTVIKPPRPAVFSAPDTPLWPPPRRQRANALLEPSATASASTSGVPVRRGLQRSASAGGLGAALDAGYSLPDYKDDDDDKENIVASVGSSKAEVRTAPSSPVLASTSISKGKGKAVVQEEYVETDVLDSESDGGSFVEHNKSFESVCETRVIDDPQVTAYFRSLGIDFP